MFVLMHGSTILGYYTDERSARGTLDRYRRMYDDESYCVVFLEVAMA